MGSAKQDNIWLRGCNITAKRYTASYIISRAVWCYDKIVNYRIAISLSDQVVQSARAYHRHSLHSMK